jgi:hypothetical protein
MSIQEQSILTTTLDCESSMYTVDNKGNSAIKKISNPIAIRNQTA